jgi:phosphate transport system substrate-binding protein
MKHLSLLTFAFLSIAFYACKEETTDTPFVIEGITTDTYPKVDGSTSTEPLQTLIACKLLGGSYYWRQHFESDGTWGLQPNYDDIPYSFFADRIKTSQTHNSFINLIDKNADFILSARKMSEDEKAYAADAGVSLIETPIALDAFIFIANPGNTVNSLTKKQIQDIYMGNITKWKEVGGSDAKINPYVRNANSGSQELMESLVMKGLVMPAWPEEMLSSMMLAFTTIRSDVNGLCYTVYYYKELIVRDNDLVKTIAVDGIYPDQNTIKNRSYPFTAEVYAVIRSDLDNASMAYKLYELIQTIEGKKVIAESGYFPN